MPEIELFLASPLGLAVKGLLVATVGVFVLGVAAAIRDGTFEWHYIDAFVRNTILGRIIPVVVIGVVGYVSGDGIITTAAIVAAGAVAAGLFNSILDSLHQLTLPPVKSAEINEPPKE